MNNYTLQKAKKAKADEFYTQYEDIEKELSHYTEHLKNKVVYCNCDKPKVSNFYFYFMNNFQELELKGLHCTHYQKDGECVHSYFDGEKETITPLIGDGDFRSQECIELLKEADIVVTNPPFSLWREFVSLLMEYEKKFVILGNKNAITYKEIFPLIKDNKLWLGHGNVKDFVQPNGAIKSFGNIGWFTNLEIKKRHEELILYKKYQGHEDEYPQYDNYDAINVDKVAEIPCDYDGVMGVPITFLDKYCPDQFEIVGLLQSSTDEQAGIPNLRFYNDFKEMRQDMSFTGCSGSKANGNPVVKGKSVKGNFLYNDQTQEFVHSCYARIAIRNKHPKNNKETRLSNEN